MLIVLLDDMGFGASSAFGGPCRMPVAESLAEEGVKFTRFHTAAVCAPTRSALLTGRNQHVAEMGGIPETATSAPGYTSVRPPSIAPLARILRDNGYATGAFGKMHQTPAWELSPTGPFDRWPTNEGFEKFYGFIGAESDHFAPPDLISGTSRVDPPQRDGYHLSEDLAEQAVAWISNVSTVEPEKPWFCYLSFGATHAPLHVPAEWRDRYRGEFAHGWDVEREQILKRQKTLGVVPQAATLAPWPDGVPAWDSLDAKARRTAERLMELYAAMAEHTDAQVGRVLAEIDRNGSRENTIVFYILGDNGPAAEAGIAGTWNEVIEVNGLDDSTEAIFERLDELGGPSTFPQYPSAWALCMATPYQWAKTVASHYGGTRNGLIVRWPERIPDSGTSRSHWHHVVDIAPTILEASGIPAPDEVDGFMQRPMDGVSMLDALTDGDSPETHHTQYFEALGNRGIYHRGWTAVTQHRHPWAASANPPGPLSKDRWELYDTSDDWTQARDLAAVRLDLLRELQDLFLIEAGRNNVLPIDDRWAERYNPKIANRPDLLGDRKSITLTPATERLRENVAPNVKNVSHRIIARIEADEDAAGVLVAQGGRFAGWSLWIDHGKPIYTYNYMGLEIAAIESPTTLTKGPHTVEVSFDYDGGGYGRGATVELIVDGLSSAIGRLERTVAFIFSQAETLDVAVNRGTAVDPRYEPGEPSRYRDRIHSVEIVLSDDRFSPSELEMERANRVAH